jgi:deoxyribonuclease V
VVKIRTRHAWNLTTAEARALQIKLARQVDSATPIKRCRTVAAVDGSSEWHGQDFQAAVVVVRADTFEPIERAASAGRSCFPYVPGLFSFRESPMVLQAFARIRSRPDVVLVDGHGLAHPRRFGIACHLGLWLNIPTIGCAKTRLCGEFSAPGSKRGDRSPLIDGGEVIGAVVRTRDSVKPVFVSVGHKCDLDSAVDLVLRLSGKYRLPAPSRMAHEYVNQVRRAAKAGLPIPE